MKKSEKTIDFGGRKLTLKTGILAEQAHGAVLASHGDTVVLATVVSSKPKQELDYFPLTVDYQEKLYAGGRIKGSRWVKRDGRPTDDEILTSRLIDRTIRPLFPNGFTKDVQVIVTVFSIDLENDPKILGGIATSAALAISSIPWDGPVGMTKVGVKDGKLESNPGQAAMKESDMDLVVSSTKDSVVMIEAGASEVTEEIILGGIELGQKENEKIITLIEDLVKDVGEKKESFEVQKIAASVDKKIKDLAKSQVKDLVAAVAKKENISSDIDEIKKAVHEELSEVEYSAVSTVVEKMFKNSVREMILSGKRPDGRKHNEVRKLTSQVGILPRTHGSGLFSRGQTQVLTIATLGTSSEGLTIETAEGEETKRYIHHYNFSPFSTGETGRVGFPGRREVGHGALAERALIPVIPSEKDFPYTIMLVSEVMSSNGSTSMASTCGSTLALMDAGVPIKAPVAGIAMGLVIEDSDKYAVLSDIMGIEDFNGDMDFKIAGTDSGITALQLDVKTLSLTHKILKEAITQAKEARAVVMDAVKSGIKEPRKSVSSFAPKITVVKIPKEKIGEIIGPGGKTIKKIMADTGANVDVEDDGSVSISGITSEIMQSAVEIVEGMVKEIQAGEVYEGVVKRVQPFGAFVEILPGREGMVHVSDMGAEFVSNPEDVVSVGDKVQVRVKEIDNLGRTNLSMNMDPSKDKEKGDRDDNRRGGARGFDRDRRGGGSRGFDRDRRGGFRDGSRGGSRGGARGFSGGGHGRGDSDGARGGGRSFSGGRGRGDGAGSRGGARGFSGSRGGDRDKRGGPHFPTSRLVDDRGNK